MLTLIQLVHLSGPLYRRATYCFQAGCDAGQSGPSCTFDGKRAKTATPIALSQLNDGVTVTIALYGAHLPRWETSAMGFSRPVRAAMVQDGD
jgi:hypothetical protein